MVARIVIINDNKLNVRKISSSLRRSCHSVFLAKSTVDAMKIVGTKAIDLVIVPLFFQKSEEFLGDFLLLRNFCGIIPIIGLTNGNKDLNALLNIGLDDIISIKIPNSVLLKKIDTLTEIKNAFNNKLLNNVFIETNPNKKIVALFYENLNFLPTDILKNTEIVSLNSWSLETCIPNADIYIINSEHNDCLKCCADIRLRRDDMYTPILLTYQHSIKNINIQKATKINFGFCDFADITPPSISLSCRINSLIRYKKLHESFLKKLEKSIYLSAIDSTTEVYNRSFFEEYIKNKKGNFNHCAIVMIDIDKFKIVNDKFGHSFADSMLRHISTTIKNCVRSSDIVARYGGDEFIIFMDSVSRETASIIAHRIRKNLEDSQYHNVICTVSIGVCCLNEQKSMSIQEAISEADKVMYDAKQNGGNAVQICA